MRSITPVFWLQGLIPSSWVDLPEPADDELVVPSDALGALEVLTDAVLAFGDAPEGGRELEAMPRQPGDDHRAWPPREPTDDEVLVGRLGVHAGASCEQGATQAWDMMGGE